MLELPLVAVVSALLSIIVSVLTLVLQRSVSARRRFRVRLGTTEVELKAGDIEQNLALLEPLIHETQRTPRVFLSYAHEDRDFAKRLVNDLEGNGVRVWFDQREIGVGDKLTDKLLSGMEISQWIVPVFSPDATTSSWFKRELELALSQEGRRRRSLVLPVLYKGDGIPSDVSERVYADFRESYQKGLGQLLAAIRREHTPQAKG